MRLEEIKEILCESGADDWEIRCTREHGWEFYLIRDKLDQNRVKDTTRINITVYVRNNGMLGNASGNIAVTEEPQNVKKEIESLVYQASLAQNNDYTLHTPKKAPPLASQPFDIAMTASDFIHALQEVKQGEDADINSTEIFVSSITSRLVTSQGIDIEETYPSSMAEVIVNARDEKSEIELYRMYRSGTCAQQRLKSDIEKTMMYGLDRLKAMPTPDLKECDVVFSTDDAVRIYDYFIERLSASMIYQKYSDWQIGEPIANDVVGDKITLRSLRYLENSSANMPYDKVGGVICDIDLLKDNVPEAYWGDRMFASYLGLADAFILSNYEATGGRMAMEELRKGRYLEIVEFSDFQVNPINGSIFGEIRLGYYHDGETTMIVKGGSVSGTMLDYVKDIRMSRELVQYDNARIPALTRIANVTIAGSGLA